jgi:hypothetical protein
VLGVNSIPLFLLFVDDSPGQKIGNRLSQSEAGQRHLTLPGKVNFALAETMGSNGSQVRGQENTNGED